MTGPANDDDRVHDEALGRAYRDAAGDGPTPPAHLDAAIRAHARRAVNARPVDAERPARDRAEHPGIERTTSRPPRWRTWQPALALAATVALAVGVAIRVQETGEADIAATVSRPIPPPAPGGASSGSPAPSADGLAEQAAPAVAPERFSITQSAKRDQRADPVEERAPSAPARTDEARSPAPAARTAPTLDAPRVEAGQNDARRGDAVRDSADPRANAAPATQGRSGAAAPEPSGGGTAALPSSAPPPSPAAAAPAAPAPASAPAAKAAVSEPPTPGERESAGRPVERREAASPETMSRGLGQLAAPARPAASAPASSEGASAVRERPPTAFPSTQAAPAAPAAAPPAAGAASAGSRRERFAGAAGDRLDTASITARRLEGRPAADWHAELRALVRAGRTEEARRLAVAYGRTFPDTPLPEDLRSLAAAP